MDDEKALPAKQSRTTDTGSVNRKFDPAGKIKRLSTQAVVAIGAITVLFPATSKLVTEAKSFYCTHISDCAPRIAVAQNTSSDGNVTQSSQGQNSEAKVGKLKHYETIDGLGAIDAYASRVLALGFEYPVEHFSIANTTRYDGEIFLVDSQGKRRVAFKRMASGNSLTIEEARSAEIAALEQAGWVITYAAPEKAKNWSNWYVVSGIRQGEAFYFRRNRSGGDTVSFEVRYPKKEQLLYGKLIGLLHRRFEHR